MSFIQSFFLLGALAAAVPVLIHLSKSRNYQRVRIGTLRFLSSVVQERRRFKKIENWPLLLCRIALLILLALLFSRPFWPASEPPLPEGAETLVLVDSSGSLAFPEAASQVSKLLKQIQKEIPPESPLTIAEFADTVAVTEEPQAVPGAPTNFTAAVDWTIERIAQSELPPAAIHLITDVQEAPLPENTPRLWPTGIETKIHVVTQKEDFNYAIEKVQLNTPFREEEVELEATLKVFGSPGSKNKRFRRVTLALSDGTRLGKDFPPEGGRVRFRWKPSASNELTGTISFEGGDPWPEDDIRHFSFTLQDRKKVLLVDGDPGDTPFLGEAYFLDKALRASGATHGQSPFIPTISYDLTTRNGLVDLSEFELLVLCNVGSLTPDEEILIHEANAQGTGVLFLLGDQTETASFRLLQSADLFPALQKVPEPRMDVVNSWESEETLAPPLAALPMVGLRSLLLRNAFEIAESDDWNLWASFSDRNPLLLEKSNLSAEQGPVMVLAHPATREWGDFPLNSLFVPLMRQLSAYLTDYSRVEDGIVSRSPGLQLRKPPGILIGENGQRTLVNVDVTEMNPTSTSVAQLRSALGIPSNGLPQNEPSSQTLPAQAEQAHELWPWILLSILMLLILENFLADRRPRLVEEAATAPTPEMS